MSFLVCVESVSLVMFNKVKLKNRSKTVLIQQSFSSDKLFHWMEKTTYFECCFAPDGLIRKQDRGTFAHMKIHLCHILFICETYNPCSLNKRGG